MAETGQKNGMEGLNISQPAKSKNRWRKIRLHPKNSVTAADLAAAITELFPQGTVGIDEGEVLRAVFLNLKK